MKDFNSLSRIEYTKESAEYSQRKKPHPNILSYFLIILLSISIIFFPAPFYEPVYAQEENEAELTPAVKGLLEGIFNYKNGNYKYSAYLLQSVKGQFSEFDFENLWTLHFHMGLLNFLVGNDTLGYEQFRKAWILIPEKMPDPYIHSSKVTKWFEGAKINKEVNSNP